MQQQVGQQRLGPCRVQRSQRLVAVAQLDRAAPAEQQDGRRLPGSAPACGSADWVLDGLDAQ
ncbi:MAG: hypothetical protein WCG47_31475, partial [Dermatophilaceae bacterium]